MAIRNFHREERSKAERILTHTVNVSKPPVSTTYILPMSLLVNRNNSFVNLPLLPNIIHFMQQLQRRRQTSENRVIPKHHIRGAILSYLDQNPSVWQNEQPLLKRKKDELDSIGNEILQQYLLKAHDGKKDERGSGNNCQGETQMQLIPPSQLHVKPDSMLVQNQEDQVKKVIETANPWALLQAFNLVETKELCKAEKEKAVQSQKHMSEILHAQTREKQSIVQQQELENKKYVELQSKALQEWKENLKLLEMRERTKTQELRRVCDEDLEKKKKRELEEIELSRRMEIAGIERCQREKQLEEQHLMLKKEEVRKRFEEVKQLKVERLAELERRRKEEEAIDMKHMADMKRRLDEEELKREKAFSERIARYEAFAKQIENHGEVVARRDLERKMEEKILREAQEKDLRDANREKRDLEELKLKKLACVETNKQMAEEWRQRNLQAQEAEKELSLEICRESEAYLNQQNLAKTRERERKKQNCELLQKQIMDNIQSKQGSCFQSMTAVEKSINRRLLHRINSDTELQSKIADILCKPKMEPN